MTIGPLAIITTNQNELPTPKGERQRYGSIAREGVLRMQRSGEGGWEGRALKVEWHAFPKSAHYSVTFGTSDDHRGLQFAFTIPWLMDVWITFSRLFARPLFTYDFDRGEDREIGISFHSGAVWWHVWVGTMASWSRQFPWCKPWRSGSFHPVDFLFGRQKVTTEVLQEARVSIPMPEGVYTGTAKVERFTRKRPRWFARDRFTTSIDVERGIPTQGKGENAWDCGDDGIYGCGVEGRSVEKAIGHYVYRVLEDRRKYGMPSDRAIRDALTTSRRNVVT